MTLHQWLIYVSVVLAIIVTPGPSALLCVSHGAAHGTLKAAATIVGGICASLTLMLGYAKGGALAVANR
jgi:homoserine/homoserine lactone efflux protein